jgi:hypothetical protein
VSFLEDEIEALADDMEQLLPRFKKSSSDGMFLSSEDQARFKRLALEAKGATDAALGTANDFSLNLVSSINAGSGGFFGGPSYSAVSEAAQILRGALNQIRRKQFSEPTAINRSKPPYVGLARIAALRSLPKKQWDFSRLVQMCTELNAAHEGDCHMTIAMLAGRLQIMPRLSSANQTFRLLQRQPTISDGTGVTHSYSPQRNRTGIQASNTRIVPGLIKFQSALQIGQLFLLLPGSFSLNFSFANLGVGVLAIRIVRFRNNFV